MPLFFGPGNNSFARCIKNCSIKKIIHNQGGGDPAQYISTTGSPTTIYPGNNYISYIYPVGSGSFISTIDLTIQFLVIGGGATGQSNSNRQTSCGGGSGGIIQGSIYLPANNLISIQVGAGGQPVSYGGGFNGSYSEISIYGGLKTAYAGSGIGGGLPSEDSSTNIVNSNVIQGLPGAISFGDYGNGYPGITGSNISLYGGITQIVCSSSGGGGCGYQGNTGGQGGFGAGNGGGPSSLDGTSAINYGAGGGGGASLVEEVYNFYGAGENGVVIIYFQYSQPSTTSYDIACPPYKCPETINKKSLNSNADVDQTLTQSARAVNAIRYAPGGKTQYGYSATIYQNSQVTYLGRVEGQPGGIGRLSARNRF
jgi:hypothetical protein